MAVAEVSGDGFGMRDNKVDISSNSLNSRDFNNDSKDVGGGNQFRPAPAQLGLPLSGYFCCILLRIFLNKKSANMADTTSRRLVELHKEHISNVSPND
jgi:hypothetical protein